MDKAKSQAIGVYVDSGNPLSAKAALVKYKPVELVPSFYLIELPPEGDRGEIAAALEPLSVHNIRRYYIFRIDQMLWIDAGSPLDSSIKDIFSRCK